MDFNYRLNWSSGYDDRGTRDAETSADQAARAIEESMETINAATERATRRSRELEQARADAVQSDDYAQHEVRIIDTTRKSTEAVEENKRAFADWQRERREAARNLGDIRLAMEPTEMVEHTAAVEETTVATGNYADMLNDPRLLRGLLTMSNNLARMTLGYNSVAAAIPTLVARIAGPGGLAVGVGLAVTALGTLIRRLRESKDETDAMAGAAERAATAIRGVETTRLDDAVTAIERTYEALRIVNQEFHNAARAEASYSLAQLSNAEKIAHAQAILADLLGEQRDLYAELDARERRMAESRALRQAQDVAEKKQELDRMQEAHATNMAHHRALRQQLEDEQAALQALKAEWLEYNEEVQRLQRVSRDLTPAGGGMIGPGQMGATSPEFLAARRRLEDPDFREDGLRIQARITELDEAIHGLSDRLERGGAGLDAAARRLEDESQRIDIELRALAEAFSTDELVDTATMLETRSKILAESTQAIAESVRATTPPQQRAIDEILRAAADGKITADETEKVARSLVTLMGGLQTNAMMVEGSIQELIDEVRREQEAVRRLQEQIRLLKQSGLRPQ